MKTFVKDPDATLDYEFDWSKWLATSGNDTISQSSWDIKPLGASTETLSLSGVPTISNGVTSAFFEGGALGERYRITNSIITSAGRIDERSFVLEIKEK